MSKMHADFYHWGWGLYHPTLKFSEKAIPVYFFKTQAKNGAWNLGYIQNAKENFL